MQTPVMNPLAHGLRRLVADPWRELTKNVPSPFWPVGMTRVAQQVNPCLWVFAPAVIILTVLPYTIRILSGCRARPHALQRSWSAASRGLASASVRPCTTPSSASRAQGWSGNVRAIHGSNTSWSNRLANKGLPTLPTKLQKMSRSSRRASRVNSFDPAMGLGFWAHRSRW